MKKEKKIVFSEETDSMITGYALGLSFLGIAIFLFFNPLYFYSATASYVVGAVLGTFGVVGTGIELSKHSKIKGMDSVSVGLLLLAIWLAFYLIFNCLWSNIVFFFFLIVGAFAIVQGFIQAVYSIVRNTNWNKSESGEQNIGKGVGQLILLLTQLCGLAIAVLNVLQVLNG